jgi:hypothetical protein
MQPQNRISALFMPRALNRIGALSALLCLTLAACVPTPPRTAAPVREAEPVERPIMATVTVTGRERCPSTYEGYNFAGSQREGDTATCFYR